MVKNRCGISLGHGTRKYATSQIELMEKAKNYFINHLVAMVKNVQQLLDHETLKSVVFPK